MSADEKRRIIVTVDDDQIILNQLVDALKEFYAVRPFKSGETALKFLENNKADLILLDCNMPNGMSGFEVLDLLQADKKLKQIPIIFLTGSIDDGDEVRALESGAVDFITKPIKVASLHKRVLMQIELMEYRTELEEMVAEQTQELTNAYKKIVEREKITLDLLAKASDMRDHDTGEHIQRTTDLSRVIAEELARMGRDDYKLTFEEANDIAEATKLHDIGKIAMPDHVLLKPGKLTEEEFEIIKKHPRYGADMLREAVKTLGEDRLLEEAYNIAFGHHEKWDGTGYPLGLQGDAIPLSARIAAIADVFDALTSERPYKKAFSVKEALEILYEGSGKHFDPVLIDIVKKHEKDFAKIKQQFS